MSSSEKTIERLTKTIEAMSNELALLREQVAYLTKKLYGKSSEKRDYNQNQLSLFDDIFVNSSRFFFIIREKKPTFQ